LAFLDVDVSEPEVCGVHYSDLRVILPVLCETCTAGDIQNTFFYKLLGGWGRGGVRALPNAGIKENIKISFTMFRPIQEGTCM
jgi:hypothetical protein